MKYSINPLLFLAIPILLLQLPGYSATGQDQPESGLRSEIAKIIRYDTEMEFREDRLMVIGVVDGPQKAVFTFCKEYLDSGADCPPHDSLLFEIGGTSKLFTAWLIRKLVENKVLGTEDRVNDLLPDSVRNEALEDLTIADLLSHQSPFPRVPDNLGQAESRPETPFSNYGERELLEFYHNFEPGAGRYYGYSHVNFALLGWIAASSTGKNTESLFEEFIFFPHKMPHTYLAPAVDRSVGPIQGFSPGGIPVIPAHPNAMSSAMGIVSCGEDLCNFLQNFIRLYKEGAETPMEILRIRGRHPDNKYLYFGQGMHLLEIKKGIVVAVQSGASPGHSCFIGIRPETETAVVVLANKSGSVHHLGLLVLRLLNNNWKR